MPYLRKMLAALTLLSVFVLLFAFPALGQQTTGAQSPAAEQAPETTTPTLHNGKIAFAGVSSQDLDTNYWENYEIYTVNADGSGLEKITNNSATDIHPEWSPDGKKIAFTRNDGSGAGDIYVMNADGTGLKKLTDTDVDIYPTWSPDGKKIAFASGRAGGGIFIMDADGDNVRRLTNSPGYETFPSWSQEGTKIAFQFQSSGNTPTSEDSEICTINVDGTGDRALTNNRTFDDLVDWSPDGRRIVVDGEGGTYVMNSNGTEKKTLHRYGQYPAWSPDGKKILLIAYEAITAVNLDGSGRTIIWRPPSDLFISDPDWQPLPGAGTGNAATDTTGTENAHTTGAGQGNGDRSSVAACYSKKPLSDTGGLTFFGPAVGLLLISGMVIRLVVHRR